MADTIPTSTLPTILRAAESLETLDLYDAVIGGHTRGTPTGAGAVVMLVLFCISALCASLIWFLIRSAERRGRK